MYLSVHMEIIIKAISLKEECSMQMSSKHVARLCVCERGGFIKLVVSVKLLFVSYISRNHLKKEKLGVLLAISASVEN